MSQREDDSLMRRKRICETRFQLNHAFKYGTMIPVQNTKGSHNIFRLDAHGQLQLPLSKQRLQEKTNKYFTCQKLFKTGLIFWENA